MVSSKMRYWFRALAGLFARHFRRCTTLACQSCAYPNNQMHFPETGDLGRPHGNRYLHILGRAVDAQEVNGTLVTSTEIEETICCRSSIRYAAVVRDAKAHITIVAVVAWLVLFVDDREYRQIVTASFGDTIAASLGVPPIDRVSLTKQGKPDRTAIERLTRRLPLAA
jgi:acyl-CoA synthetase (AMP-forming)/AMP-acid ligase II